MSGAQQHTRAGASGAERKLREPAAAARRLPVRAGSPFRLRAGVRSRCVLGGGGKQLLLRYFPNPSDDCGHESRRKGEAQLVMIRDLARARSRGSVELRLLPSAAARLPATAGPALLGSLPPAFTFSLMCLDLGAKARVRWVRGVTLPAFTSRLSLAREPMRQNLVRRFRGTPGPGQAGRTPGLSLPPGAISDPETLPASQVPLGPSKMGQSRSARWGLRGAASSAAARPNTSPVSQPLAGKAAYLSPRQG